MSMGVRTGYNERREMYVADGNTVRVVVPEYSPSAGAVPERRVRAAERAIERPSVRSTVRAAERPIPRRQQERALTMDLPFLFVLSIALAITMVICYNYLNLNASINAHMDNIKMMETRLETLKTENDALEQSIDISVDLNHVYNVAVNELGMVHAGNDHVILYDKTESEYVRQYENIPNKKSE